MHTFTNIILSDEIELAWCASVAHIPGRAGFFYARPLLHSRNAFASHSASNNSHLRRKTWIHEWKRCDPTLHLLLAYGARHRPRTKVRGRESPRWRWHHRYHGHGPVRSGSEVRGKNLTGTFRESNVHRVPECQGVMYVRDTEKRGWKTVGRGFLPRDSAIAAANFQSVSTVLRSWWRYPIDEFRIWGQTWRRKCLVVIFVPVCQFRRIL